MDDIIKPFVKWRYKHFTDRQFISILSVLVGAISGVVAVIMKNAVHHLYKLLHNFSEPYEYLKLAYPIVGISLTVYLATRFFKTNTGHGIPKVLFAISRNNGIIRLKSLFTSVLFSVLTVGFGGSAGLEGPSASAGATVGSRIARLFHLNYKQFMVLIGCGATGAIAAIFNTPIASIIFSLEILMLDLSIISIIPLLISSITALIVSYSFLGQQTIYVAEEGLSFHLAHAHIYVVLGIFAGLWSSFFSYIYQKVENFFEHIEKKYIRVLIGGLGLTLLIFVFPSLYGEGYYVINQCIEENTSFIQGSILDTFVPTTSHAIILLLAIIIIFKTFATNLTFGAGGVGGIFAPALFIGAVTGLLFSFILKSFGVDDIPTESLVLVGMAGFMSGILHGPLTAIFLIAEITKGYELIVPLMLTSVISFSIARIFFKNSVYTIELARRKELLTHDKNKSVLSLMKLESLIEKDFEILRPNENLGDFVEKIKKTRRNVYPVLNDENYMVGILTLDDVKDIIFEPILYNKIQIREIMYQPRTFVSINDSVESIAKKIHASGRYNIPVLDNGKYIGFVSRANLFAVFQKELTKVSLSE